MAKKAKAKRTTCPECKAFATVKSTIPAKTHVSRRYICNSCNHRFTIKTPHGGDACTGQPQSLEIAEHNIGHRVLP